MSSDNKLNLSDFFKSRKCVTTNSLFCDSEKRNMSINEYSKSKKAKSVHSIDSDRSICQMLRNINGMTNFSYHEQVVILINFANNAVINLGKHSKNPGNRWGGRKTRSDFTEKKRKQALEILDNPHHEVFEELKKLYNSVDNESVLDYIVEITYYMERINSKTLEYEIGKNNNE
jgi:hypothetical protein